MRSCLFCQSAEHPWTLFRPHLPNTLQFYPKLTGLPALPRWSRTPPQPLNVLDPTPSSPSVLCPLCFRPKGRTVPLTPGAARVCEGPVTPASFSTAPFPLPSEFQVDGSRWEEATTPLLLARVHHPLSPSSGWGGGTPGRARQSAAEPARGAAGGSRGGGGGGVTGTRAWLWCACPWAGRRGGWGEEEEGERRRERGGGWRGGGLGPQLSRGASWPSALRQVHPPGERAPSVSPLQVGRAGLR